MTRTRLPAVVALACVLVAAAGCGGGCSCSIDSRTNVPSTRKDKDDDPKYRQSMYDAWDTERLLPGKWQSQKAKARLEFGTGAGGRSVYTCYRAEPQRLVLWHSGTYYVSAGHLYFRVERCEEPVPEVGGLLKCELFAFSDGGRLGLRGFPGHPGDRVYFVRLPPPEDDKP
jgi:hypothetical protein